MNDASSVKKPPGLFYFEGKPINRSTVEKATTKKFLKAVLCGYCGGPLKKGYQCKECLIRKPSSQLEGTTDHKQILSAWRDGEYTTNVENERLRIKGPSIHEGYSMGSPSISQISLGDGINASEFMDQPSATSTKGVKNRSSIVSVTKLQTSEHPDTRNWTNESIEYTGALLMGWKSNKLRIEPKEMSYDFRRHLFKGKITDDHFYMRPRTEREFAWETAPERLWLHGHHSMKMNEQLVGGTFSTKEYDVLKDQHAVNETVKKTRLHGYRMPGHYSPERSGINSSSKMESLRKPSQISDSEFGHLLYGQPSGYAYSPREPTPLPNITSPISTQNFRPAMSARAKSRENSRATNRSGRDSAGANADADGRKNDSNGGSDSRSGSQKSNLHSRGGQSAAVGSGLLIESQDAALFWQQQNPPRDFKMSGGAISRRGPGSLAVTANNLKPGGYRHFRSTGGEDRPHYVDRSHNLRKMKFLSLPPSAT